MSKKKTLLLALTAMFLWGSLFPMVKLGYTAYNINSTSDILFFAGVRFTVCGLIITIFSLIRNKENFVPVKSSIIAIMLSGLFAIILHYAFTYTGLKYSDSSKTAILKQVGVLFYVCFSVLFFKDDKLSVRKFVGVVLGFAGIAVINMSSSGFSLHFGDILIIAASFCTVFSNIISKNLFDKLEPITATGCSQLFGGIVLLAVGKVMGGSMDFSFDFSALIMMYICLASILGYCIWFITVKHGQLSKLFIIKFAEPVFASVIGTVILQENILNVQYLLSFILISVGIYISN